MSETWQIKLWTDSRSFQSFLFRRGVCECLYIQHQGETQLILVKLSTTQKSTSWVASSVLLHLHSGGVTFQHVSDPAVVQRSIYELLQADAGYSHTGTSTDQSRPCQKARINAKVSAKYCMCKLWLWMTVWMFLLWNKSVMFYLRMTPVADGWLRKT